METLKPILCTAQVRPASGKADLAALTDLLSQQTNPAVLGGNASVRGYSVFTAEPLEVFEFHLKDPEPFEQIAAVLSKYRMVTGERTEKVSDPFNCRAVFGGGWIGYFGYELGRFVERLPGRAVDDVGLAVVRLAFYDKAIVYDHAAQAFGLAALELDGEAVSVEAKFAALQGWLDAARGHAVHPPRPAALDSFPAGAFAGNMTQAAYLAAIERIKQYIHDGDTYQINFSQRFCADFAGRPVDLFHWQNTFNPSPYAAFLAWEDCAVVSASPELFLQVDGDRIVTRPIKGTRSRNPLLPDEAAENQAAYQDLLDSDKDRAELAMIVDLERNDLARICVPGTRRVACGREIEIFPTVYHAAGVVEGTLAGMESGKTTEKVSDPLSWKESVAWGARTAAILKTTFPGGSITGAPKIRSMEIIDELEPTARGVYTGSIGWIGIDGNLCLNIAIRTIVIKGRRAYVQTGGGIVADSDPQAEWGETLTKARALLASLLAV